MWKTNEKKKNYKYVSTCYFGHVVHVCVCLHFHNKILLCHSWYILRVLFLMYNTYLHYTYKKKKKSTGVKSNKKKANFYTGGIFHALNNHKGCVYRLLLFVYNIEGCNLKKICIRLGQICVNCGFFFIETIFK